MTRTTIRTNPLSLYPAYVVLKDPELRLSEATPVFPHCGNILIGVESVGFFDHLRELVSAEAPEWAENIDVVSTVALSPAAKVRLRKELELTDRNARAHLRMTAGLFSHPQKLIAETVLWLSRLADSLSREVPVGTREEEARKFLQQRDALILLNCWTIVSGIALIELRRRLYSVPHSLSSLLSRVSVRMSECLDAVTHVPDSEPAIAALHGVLEFLQAGDPIEKANQAHGLQDRIQRFQFFIDRAIVVIGTNDHLLSRDERAFFESAARDVRAYTASREANTRDTGTPGVATSGSPESVETSSPFQEAPRCAASAKATDTANNAASQPRETPTSATPIVPAAKSAPAVTWREFCDGLALDDVNRRLRLGNRTFEFTGKTASDRFMFMSLIAEGRGHWVSTATLQGPRSPWHGCICTKHAVGSCAAKIRKALRAKNLHVLATAIETRTIRESPQARLVWPPPDTSV